MFPIMSLLVGSLFLHAEPLQELTLQQVLKANTAAITSIRSIHVTIDESNNAAPSPKEKNSPTEMRPHITIEWWKDGTRERVKQNWHLHGKRNPNLDASNGPNGYKALHGYDPDNEPPPSESDSTSAGGEFNKPQIDDALSGYARAYSYLAPFPVESGTLEAYVTKYPDSKLAATPATSKLGCYEITLKEKWPPPSGTDDIRDLRIFVDPKVGFWIRRIERGPAQKSTNQGDKGTSIFEVQEFKDCGDGIFWPLRISQSTRWAGQTNGFDVTIRHTLHSINQPLLDDDFEVHFPDWLIVHDRPSGRVFIWGPDEKPRMTLGSQAEYEEWNKPRAAARMETGIPNQIRWLWLAGISIVVGTVLFFILRRRSKTSIA